MKRFICLPLIALLMALLPTLDATAQIRFGVKAGVAISDLSFTHGYDASNITGFTGGLMTEIMLPIVGLGVEGSLMYARKGYSANGHDKHLDYLDIPVNLKWKFGLPIIKLFLTTGPNFGFLIDNNLGHSIKEKTFDFGWNVGAGVELLKKVQVAAAYGWGITDAVTLANVAKAKTRGWSITAAYLF